MQPTFSSVVQDWDWFRAQTQRFGFKATDVFYGESTVRRPRDGALYAAITSNAPNRSDLGQSAHRCPTK